MNVELPDGTILTDIPEGTTREQLRTKLKANGYDVSKLGTEEATPTRTALPKSAAPAAEKPGLIERHPLTRSLRAYGNFAGDALVGLGKGTRDLVKGSGLETVAPEGQMLPARPDTADQDAALEQLYKDAGGGKYLGKLTAENIAVAGPAGKAAEGAMGLIKGSGMLAKALRGATGAATAGGVSGGMVAPAEGETRLENAKQGAALGLLMAPLVGLGSAGIRAVAGPKTPSTTVNAAREAQEAGYVIPPTQVKPSLLNRMMEGTAGKLTTAQNASAMNQETSNRLLKKAIGATDDLSPEVLAGIRSKANKAYSDLGNFGTITADEAFAKTARDAGRRAEGFAKDFPELVNKDVDTLVESFANKKTFDSQSAIEAIKRLREGQRTVAGNPQASAELKDFGRTQGKLADAVESLVERNLDQAGRPELLSSFRDARQTLARVYDVEKVMNPASGNVDVRKLKKALEKGRLTGELETAAKFGQSFPTASKPVEQMGSLPQFSPLDLAGTVITGGVGASQQGPGGASLGLLWPAARILSRKGALSPMVQRNLTKQGISAPDAEMVARILRQSGAVAGTAANDF